MATKRVPAGYEKVCPNCGQVAHVDRVCCTGCGHVFRTTFVAETPPISRGPEKTMAVRQGWVPPPDTPIPPYHVPLAAAVPVKPPRNTARIAIVAGVLALSVVVGVILLLMAASFSAARVLRQSSESAEIMGGTGEPSGIERFIAHPCNVTVHMHRSVLTHDYPLAVTTPDDLMHYEMGMGQEPESMIRAGKIVQLESNDTVNFIGITENNNAAIKVMDGPNAGLTGFTHESCVMYSDGSYE